MKKSSLSKIFLFLLLAVIVLYSPMIQFPAKLHLCGKGYVDCDVVARFDDMDSCESASQMGGWYCDRSDKSRIICREEESDLVDSYCSK